jgi:hypothetical protein
MSVVPIALGFGVAMVAFAVAVPWLIHESRRPLRVAPVPVSRDPEHPVLSSLVISTRSLLVSILPRHTTPTVTDAAETWRTSFADGRRCETHPRSESFAPAPGAASREGVPVPPAGPNTERERRYAYASMRSHTTGRGGRTKAQLADEARRRSPKGRSRTSRTQLERRLGR